MNLNITVDQWVLLKIIDEKEPLSQKELGEFSIRDKASIARTMVLLEKKGYVSRTPIPDNRREYTISLSKGGKQLVQANMEMIRAHRRKSLEGFSPEEVHTLQQMLLRIQDNLKE
ncbi:MAG: MarR family transcriptional regulator [Bacteroidota bacterium]